VHSESYDLTRDLLDAKGWKELRHFEELLECFEKATKRAEGNAITGSHGALWEIIPIVNYLSNTLKKRADEITAWASLSNDHYRLDLDLPNQTAKGHRRKVTPTSHSRLKTPQVANGQVQGTNGARKSRCKWKLDGTRRKEAYPIIPLRSAAGRGERLLGFV